MKFKWMGALCVLLLVSACKQKAERVEVDTTGPAPTEIVETPVKAGQPTIEIANWEETQQLVARNTGKVVVLDLWATW